MPKCDCCGEELPEVEQVIAELVEAICVGFHVGLSPADLLEILAAHIREHETPDPGDVESLESLNLTKN